jgi:hypothetical protein
MALSIHAVNAQLERVVRRSDEAYEILNDLLLELWGEDGEELEGTDLEDIEARLRGVEQELVAPLRHLGETAVAVRRLARRG